MRNGRACHVHDVRDIGHALLDMAEKPENTKPGRIAELLHGGGNIRNRILPPKMPDYFLFSFVMLMRQNPKCFCHNSAPSNKLSILCPFYYTDGSYKNQYSLIFAFFKKASI